MSFAHWVRIGALFTAYFLTGPAWAKSRLSLIPVQILGYDDADLLVRVEVPCGTRFYGVVLRPLSSQVLEIAGAVLEPSVVCTGLSQPQTLRLDFLDVEGFERIEARADLPPVTVRVRRLETVRRREGVMSQVWAQGAEETCVKPLGFVARGTQATGVSVGVLEMAPRSGIQTSSHRVEPTCQKPKRWVKVSGLRLHSGQSLGMLSPSRRPR